MLDIFSFQNLYILCSVLVVARNMTQSLQSKTLILNLKLYFDSLDIILQ